MVIPPYMNYISKYIQNNIIEFMNQMINRIYPLSKNTASKANNCVFKSGFIQNKQAF